MQIPHRSPPQACSLWRHEVLFGLQLHGRYGMAVKRLPRPKDCRICASCPWRERANDVSRFALLHTHEARIKHRCLPWHTSHRSPSLMAKPSKLILHQAWCAVCSLIALQSHCWLCMHGCMLYLQLSLDQAVRNNYSPWDLQCCTGC